MAGSKGRLLRAVRGCALALIVFAVQAFSNRSAFGQIGPVYPDDSISAREGLARAAELAAGGNATEAARVVQGVLDGDADAVLESPSDSNLFLAVRRRAHELVLGSPALLERYRAAEEGSARALLDAGDIERVERTRLLTRAGLDAALRLAQEEIESARFEAARLTLEQLNQHPDRTGTGADQRGSQDAAKLALTLARYVDRPEVRAWAEAWAAEARLPGPGGAPPKVGAPAQAPATVPMYSPLTELPAIDLEGLVDRPLQSAWLSQDAEADAVDSARLAQNPRRLFGREITDEPWVLPTVAGEVVYTNDGRWISAWDRYTLQPLWRVSPAAADQSDQNAEGSPVVRGREERTVYRPGQTTLEDSASVTVTGGVVVATTGLAVQGGRDGDARVHAIDAATGRVLWSSSPAAQSVALATAIIRGPALIVGDTVVVSLRKPPQTRRMATAYLASLDLWTGKLRWARLLGSAGAVFQRGQRVAESAVCDRGVVYYTDEIGLTAAVEAQSGRVVWVRRARSEVTMRSDTAPAWSSSSPVVDGTAVLTISPAHDDVVRLDAGTGATIAHRRASELGDPRYLLRVGPWLAAIGLESVSLVPLAQLEQGEVRRVGLPTDSKMQGRSVVVGGTRGAELLVPLSDGLAVIDPARPEQVSKVALEFSGNVVAVGSHVLMASKGRLHSYLVWDVAERLLRQRMDRDPSDPRAAMTLTELAYRSGRPGLIAGAADRVISAVERAPTSPSRVATRQSLYEALRRMTQAALDGGARLGDAAPIVPPVVAQAEGPIITDLAVLDALIERLGKLAETPSERVDHALALGRLRERRPEGAASAAAAYQGVLEDAELSLATWNGPRQSVRADIEATQRIRELVKRAGRSAYAVFDARASSELAARTPSVSEPGRAAAVPAASPTIEGEEFESLARRYPAARVGPELWARAASEYERTGRRGQALAALGSGLVSAEWAVSAGESLVGSRVGEIAGRLVRALDQNDRSSAASQLLERVTREYPLVKLSAGGVPIDAAALLAELGARVAGSERLARIGRAVGVDVQVIDGWALVRPISQAFAVRATEHVMMISREQRELGLFGSQPEGQLKALWTRGYRGEATPVVVSVDAQSVYVFWPSDEGGSLERIDAVGGATRWRTPAFAGMFPVVADNDAGARPTEISTPLDGRVKSNDLLMTMDEQTAVLAERSGRMAAFDLGSGRTLWTGSAVVQQVFDMAAGPGAGAGAGQNSLVIAGAAERPAAAGEQPALEPTIASYDLRTGRLAHQMKGLGGDVYWVRTTPGGDVIVGLEHKVASVNLPASALNWEISDPTARQTPAAWVFGARLYVQTASGSKNLWVASLVKGERRPGLLDPRGRLEEPPVRASAIGRGPNANVMFCGRRGLAIFDPASELVGLDSLSGAVDMLPPELVDGMVVALESARVPGPAGPTATIHLMESGSGKLISSRGIVLHEEPREMMVLDGRIVISTESLTLVVPVPVPVEGK